MKAPRLSVDLVPERMWRRNVRAVVGKTTWDALRWHFGATLCKPSFLKIDFPTKKHRAKLRCAVCSAEPRRLELHEEWRYDDIRRSQRLVALIPICSACHLSKHLGYANVIGRADEALSHLAKVNQWPLKQAERYRTQVFEKWEKRRLFEYSLDLKLLTRHIPKSKIHPEWLDNLGNWFGTKLDSIIWAHDLLASDALVLDTETTGLPRENSNVEVIELAIINMKGKVLYNSLFRPLYPIPNTVIEIHGIRNSHVRRAPRFSTEIELIRKALNGKVVVSFNAEFDREVSWNTCALHEVAPPNCSWECAMQAFWTFEGRPYLRLPGGSHRALGDARAALRLIRKMARADP